MKLLAKPSKLAFMLTATAAGLLMGDAAMADTLGTVLTTSASNNFLATNNFITGFMYLAGIGMGAAGIFKLRDYMKDDQGRASLKVPAGLLIAASLALAMPSYLKTGVDTTFGTGASMNSLSGSSLGR